MLDTSSKSFTRELAGAGLAALVAVLILFVPFPFNAALILAPVCALAVLAFPATVPLFLVASVPAQDALPIPEGVPLTVTRVAVATAFAAAPLIVLGRTKWLQIPQLIPIAGVFIAILGLSIWNATDAALGYSPVYQWAVAVFTFWVVIEFVRTRGRVLLMTMLLAILVGLQGLYGALQAVLGMGPESFSIGMGLSRAYGTFGMPNSYAAYLEMATLPLIPVSIWAVQHAWSVFRSYRVQRLHGMLASARMRRELYLATGLALVLLGGAAAGLGGIAMSFSRGAWLGTAAAALVIVVLLGRRVLATTAVAGLALGLVLMLGAPVPVVSVLEDRATQLVDQIQIADARSLTLTDENFATVERLAHWQTAIAMWEDHPWLGIGAGSFNERFPDYAVHPVFTESQGHAHNYYLHLLAVNGIVGLIGYLVLLGAALMVGWRAVRSASPLGRAVGIGATGMTSALLVHNMVENLHVLNISIQIFAVWGLAYVASHWGNDTEEDDSRNDSPSLLYDSLRRTVGRKTTESKTGG